MTPDQLFSACQFKTGSVELDGIGSLDIRELSLSDRMALLDVSGDDVPLRLATIIKAGAPMFADTDVGQIIDNLPPAETMAISEAVLELSGMVGETEKN